MDRLDELYNYVKDVNPTMETIQAFLDIVTIIKDKEVTTDMVTGLVSIINRDMVSYFLFINSMIHGLISLRNNIKDIRDMKMDEMEDDKIYERIILTMLGK